MALHEPTLNMQVLEDENILAVIMENLDSPPTMFNLALVLPVAKAVLERFPKQLLMATLSSLSSEMRLLAILYIALKQDDVTQASMIPLLWNYLRHENAPGLVLPTFTASRFTIPKGLSNPFETLRKLAAVWSAVEGLASGFVENSIKFIRDCKAAEATGLELLRYYRGLRLRPLSHLWNRAIYSVGFPGFENMDQPQPWSLPPRACEIYRVRRALWRLEIFAAVSYNPYTFPNEGTVDLGTTEFHHTDPILIPAMPPRYDEGTRMLLASLQASELGELESVYDYLWRETIGKVYQNKIDPHMPCLKELSNQVVVKRMAGLSLDAVEYSQSEEDSFPTLSKMIRDTNRDRMDYDRYLAYFMSRGLPFIHRTHQQITRDGGKIVPNNYPPLRYRCLKGLRDIWNDMNTSRSGDLRRSYNMRLTHINAGDSVTRIGPSAEDGSGAGTYCAMYLQTRWSNDILIQNLWRAGCYFWER